MEIQRARPEDAPFVRRIARAAFSPYIRRIGRKPAPMLADFSALIAAGKVWVASDFADIFGFIVLHDGDSALLIDSVAVDPERHGEGLGRMLLAFAEREAARRGLERLYLYTNAKMTENLAFYPNLGWREVERRRENGFDRVYFEKSLDKLRS